MITLVDAKVFMDSFGTDKDISTNKNLAVNPTDEMGIQSFEMEGSGQRKITELLLEQVLLKF